MKADKAREMSGAELHTKEKELRKAFRLRLQSVGQIDNA